MDFHVWAKLDTDGRIQSVQSTCTQSPQRSSPVWPFVPTHELDGGPSQPGNEKTERVVPYVEKKELVNKLDAKVDEMSLIMRQLAELSKRVKVQEKLITQYEEKLSGKEKQIKTLEKENKLLKLEKRWKRKTVSEGPQSEHSAKYCESSNLDFRMICSLENSGRPSSWPGDKFVQASQFAVESAADTNQDTVEKVELDEVDGVDAPIPDAENSRGATRPSSLRLGFGVFASLSGNDVDLEGHFNMQHRSSTACNGNGYSYVKQQEQLDLHSTNLQHEHLALSEESDNIKERKSETSEKKTVKHLLGYVDSDGYLNMNNSEDMRSMGDRVYSFSKEMDENFNPEEGKRVFDKRETYIDNEAIHSTWNDVKNGNVIIQNKDAESIPDVHVLLPDGYLEPKGCTTNNDFYADIEVPLETYAPPLPVREVRSESCSVRSDSPTVRSDSLDDKGSSIFDRQASSSSCSSSHSDKNTVFDECNRRTSLPVTQGKLEKSRSANSFELPRDRQSFQQSPSLERSPGLDKRKDDHLNNVLKDMRTTMEWNKAKKRLISKSHDNTVEQVEHRLRSTVQEVYEAFSMLHVEKGSRLKRYTKEKVMERVTEKLSKSEADASASDEFIKKCLDFVMSTYPC